MRPAREDRWAAREISQIETYGALSRLHAMGHRNGFSRSAVYDTRFHGHDVTCAAWRAMGRFYSALVLLGLGLGGAGGLVDLGHVSVLDQPIDGLGTADGVADGGHAAVGEELCLGGLDVLDAGALELAVDVLIGDLDLELAGERVKGEGLTGDVVGLTVQVGDEVLGADAVGLQPAVEAHAAGGKALQEVLAELARGTRGRRRWPDGAGRR